MVRMSLRFLANASSTDLFGKRRKARGRPLNPGRGEPLHPLFPGASSTDLFGKRRKARGRPLNPGRGEPLHPLFLMQINKNKRVMWSFCLTHTLHEGFQVEVAA